MALRLRKLTKEEDTTLEQLLHARKVPAGKLKRAQIIWLASQGLATPEIATQLKVSERMVRNRLHRFNEQGLLGLEEAPRSGGPCPTPQRKSAVSSRPPSPIPAIWERTMRTGRWIGWSSTCTASRGSACNAAASASSSSPKASGGDTKKRGLASGSIPTSPKKGGPSRPSTPPLQKTV